MDATPLWWPPVDPETQRELVAFLTERGVDPDDIAKGIREDSLWELTTESLLATRDDLTADELGRRAGLTPEQFHTQMLEQGICEQVLDRELKSKVKISDADAKKAGEPANMREAAIPKPPAGDASTKRQS